MSAGRAWGAPGTASERNWRFIMARQAQITVDRIANNLVIEFAHGKRIELNPFDLTEQVRE